MDEKQKEILVVDDQETERTLLSEMVRRLGYATETAEDGFEALSDIRLGFDAVLLDADMPGLDGFEVLRRIRNDGPHSDVAVILVTGFDSEEDKRRAAEAGADDFLAKPVQLTDLAAHLEGLLAKDKSTGTGGETEPREEELEKTVEELARAHREVHCAEIETIERLALAAEYRDAGTGQHVRRIGKYCALIGKRLHLSPGEIEVLRHAAPLHDVGKIGIPDRILLKPGELGREEWKIMRQHTSIGARLLSGSSSRFLQAGQQTALTHHENWNGTGYPEGLQGKNIPFYGRIAALADVFDALTTERPYRRALEVERAVETIRNARGEKFDPELLDLFLQDFHEVLAIRDEEQEKSPPLADDSHA